MEKTTFLDRYDVGNSNISHVEQRLTAESHRTNDTIRRPYGDRYRVGYHDDRNVERTGSMQGRYDMTNSDNYKTYCKTNRAYKDRYSYKNEDNDIVNAYNDNDQSPREATGGRYRYNTNKITHPNERLEVPNNRATADNICHIGRNDSAKEVGFVDRYS